LTIKPDAPLPIGVSSLGTQTPWLEDRATYGQGVSILELLRKLRASVSGPKSHPLAQLRMNRDCLAYEAWLKWCPYGSHGTLAES
jgi:hypothetical protein